MDSYRSSKAHLRDGTPLATFTIGCLKTVESQDNIACFFSYLMDNVRR